MFLWISGSLITCTTEEWQGPTPGVHFREMSILERFFCRVRSLYNYADFFLALLQDLNRQVVKSDVASFTIPELEFESPPFSHKGGKVDNISFLQRKRAHGAWDRA